MAVTPPSVKYKYRKFPAQDKDTGIYTQGEFSRVDAAVQNTQDAVTNIISSGATSVFGASGPSHSVGLVPDPGSTAGTTRFLREDATFQPISVFGAAGPSHSSGLVPDPGSTSNSPLLRLLREDSTWFTLGNGFTIVRARGGGLDDSANINAAFATVKTVLLTDSAYQINTQVNIPTNGRLTGCGRGATVLTMGGPNWGLVIGNGGASSEMCTIDRLGIKGTCNIAISINGVADEVLINEVDIEGVVAGSIQAGVQISSGLPYYVRIYNCKINQCVVYAVGGSPSPQNGAAFLDIVNVNIGGNNLTSFGINTVGIGLNLINCQILGCTQNGINATGVSPMSASQIVTMIGCQIDSCGADGALFESWDSVFVHSSWVSANGGNGLWCYQCNSITSVGNRIHFNGHFGVSLTGGNGTTLGFDAELTGNHICNNGTAAAGTYGGILLSGMSRVNVSGNKANNKALGSSITPHQEWGLVVDGTCTQINSSGNDFNNNATSPWNINGTATFVSIRDPVQTDIAHLPPAAACIGSIIEVYNLDASSRGFGATPVAGTFFNGLVRSNGSGWTVCGI